MAANRTLQHLSNQDPNIMKIGVDAGGSLIKAAWMESGMLRLNMFPVSEREEITSWINGLDQPAVCLTGGKAALLQTGLVNKADAIAEFEATNRGVHYFLDKYGIEERSFILTNVGTGTSIHHMDRNFQQRIGGTGVGGGTLIGLSRLLTGLSEYESIIKLAAAGSRERIDMKVSQIYEGAEPPIPGDLTASNFGNILLNYGNLSFPQEDLLAAVVGLVGETVATASVLAAGQCRVSTILFIGSSFIRNDLLKEVVISYTKLRGAHPLFIENGGYSGAVGALLSLG